MFARVPGHMAKAVASALVVAGITMVPAATATTVTESYPETPAINADLPIIHTTHGSDHVKANILNPRPICNPWEDHRTVVYKVTDTFMPVGTISTTNQTEKDIPLQQDLSKSQSISLEVNGGVSSTTSINAGAEHKGVSTGISHEIARSLGASASYSLSWEAGQSIGPYDVPANHTGEATYGFRVLNMTGTQQYCKPNGTWSTPTAWSALQPVKNEVRVKLYDKLSDSFEPNKDAQNTKPVVEEEAKDPKGDAEVVKDNEVPVEGEVSTEAEAEKEIAEDKKQQSEIDSKKDGKSELDLKPYLTTSGAKHSGFAGTVALNLENVGTKRYYGNAPAVQFRVDVKTDKGPQGVDRLITPRSSNGAHIRDLGFNEEKSTRTFEVTLSNPINSGDKVRVANLDFGDGNTKEGRLHNYIEVTQTGRLKGDDSKSNDQNVDSRKATFNDFGKAHAGTF